ncbi:MAG: NTP transferase domain-containing protein [Lachnospiraceae bacterium]|nr:NTP transferase domain-containing protein [Lachnospiraceae bacterium]
MKVVILAGGTRSTISNEQQGIPKPMVEIGGKPLLWHIMKSFSAYGFHEFIICGGYKVSLIKEYFMDFYIYQSDITVDLQNNTVQIHKNRTEDWKVTVVDTGLYSGTGMRVAQIENYIDDDTFIVTNGDCLSDIDIKDMLAYHETKGKKATMAVARPTGRNETLQIAADGRIMRNEDNHRESQAWTNACMYVLDRKVFHILNGNYSLEDLLTDNLADDGQLITYKHNGFWTPVETYRDRVNMENLWNAGVAPWIRVQQ